MNQHVGIQMHGARPPFTPSQWQELEHQALIFKYMTAGIPVPPDLLIPIRKSLEAIGTGLFHQQHHHPSMPWSSFHLGFAKNCDPEPGRCRRTDGKKWRCSKDAFPDSKYCERHMHRGRNRSRKPVETPVAHSSSLTLSTTTTSRNSNNNSSSSNNNISSITNPTLSFNTPYSSSRLNTGSGIVQPPTANTNSNLTHFSIDSGSYAIPSKDYRYMKGDIDEHIFFSSEDSGTSRAVGIDSQSVLSSSVDSGWRSLPSKSLAAPFGSHSGLSTAKQQYSFLNSTFGGVETEHSNNGAANVKLEEQPLRHFFDEWPRSSRDTSAISWTDLDEERSNRSSTTQLSISIPITSSDFSASSSRSPSRGCK